MTPLTARILSAIALLAVISPASAQEAGEFGLGLGISTLGPTVEGSYRFNDRFGVRMPLGYLTFDDERTRDGIKYNVDASGGGLGLLGDYYTGLGGLRVSGGAFISRYELDGRGRGSGTIGDNTYSNVDMDFSAESRNSVMPAISVGYDGNIGARWTLSADLGAMYTGGFDIDLKDRSGQVSQADIDREIKDAEDDIPNVLPYLKLTATFRF